MTGLSRAQARRVEQLLINYHGLSTTGGTLLNRINSVAAQNLNSEALRYGRYLLNSLGYMH